MKKIMIVFLLMVSLFMFVGCTSQTTTSNTDSTSESISSTQSEASTPLNQESLLSSLSQAIKDIFD